MAKVDNSTKGWGNVLKPQSQADTAEMIQPREVKDKTDYIDALARRLSTLSMDGNPTDMSQVFSGDNSSVSLVRGVKLFGLEPFPRQMREEILLSLAYYRTDAYRDRLIRSFGYERQEDMPVGVRSSYNQVLTIGRNAYRDLTFRAVKNTGSFYTEGKDKHTVWLNPDDCNAINNRLFGSIAAHEIAHRLYNSEGIQTLSPGIYKSNLQMKHGIAYGRDDSPLNEIDRTDIDIEKGVALYRAYEQDPQVVESRRKSGVEGLEEYSEILKTTSTEELYDMFFKDSLEHDNIGKERAADVSAVRIQMFRDGIFNPFSGERITRDHVEKFINLHPDMRVNIYWNSSQMLRFFNDIASREDGKRLTLHPLNGRKDIEESSFRSQRRNILSFSEMASINFDREMALTQESEKEEQNKGIKR